MARNFTLANNISSASAGGVALITLDVNKRYHGVQLFPTATSDAPGVTPITDPTLIVDKVQLLVNGQTVREISGVDIVKLCKLNQKGYVAANNLLAIYFSEPWRASVMAEEATAWDMFGESTFKIRVYFKAGIYNVGLTALTVWDLKMNPVITLPNGQKRKFLQIIRQQYVPFNVPAGEFDLPTIPNDWPIQRLHFQASTGTISRQRVFLNNQVLFEGTNAENINLYSQYNIDATQFTASILPDYTQQIGDDMGNVVAGSSQNPAFVVKQTSSAANVTNVLVETKSDIYV